MATGTSTTTQIPAPVLAYYDRILLRRATPFIAHHMFGQKRPIPQGNGTTPTFRRYTALPVNVAPLVEGVTPTSQQLAKTDVSCVVTQYGAYVSITDYVQYVTQDPILQEAAEILGENAGQTLDTVYRDILVAGTSVFYASGVTARTAVVAGIAAADFNKIIRALRTANAKYWREAPIQATDGVGTAPISAAYFAICHPYTTFDLRNTLSTAFKQVHEYATYEQAVPGEVGSYGQIRFIESTLAKFWNNKAGGASTSKYFSGTGTATRVDVFATLIFGMDAYGITPLSGKELQNIVKPLGSGDDPLDQRSTSGWKAQTSCVILNDSFMYRYEHAVSK
jgi:N4-gp56 family major capsid protein